MPHTWVGPFKTADIIPSFGLLMVDIRCLVESLHAQSGSGDHLAFVSATSCSVMTQTNIRRVARSEDVYKSSCDRRCTVLSIVQSLTVTVIIVSLFCYQSVQVDCSTQSAATNNYRASLSTLGLTMTCCERDLANTVVARTAAQTYAEILMHSAICTSCQILKLLLSKS